MSEESTIKRCAIYTRKSTEEGLDKEFNSLEIQFDACASYIHSQAANGWELIDNHYDDPGYSGGNMNRPALQVLLRARGADAPRRTLMGRPQAYSLFNIVNFALALIFA